MKKLKEYISETVIKSPSDLVGMRFLLIDLKSQSSEKYTVEPYENVVKAISELDVESARASLEKFVKDTNISAVMINQQYIICKIGKSDIQNIMVKPKQVQKQNQSDVLQ